MSTATFSQLIILIHQLRVMPAPAHCECTVFDSVVHMLCISSFDMHVSLCFALLCTYRKKSFPLLTMKVVDDLASLNYIDEVNL